MKHLFAFCLIVLLTGCTHSEVQYYGAVDKAEKTVTVAAGTETVKGEIKRVLIRNGWILRAYEGPQVTTRRAPKTLASWKHGTYVTRYALYIKLKEDKKRSRYCWWEQKFNDYDIALIDNKNSTEIFSINGADCENAVAEAFENALIGAPHNLPGKVSKPEFSQVLHE